MIIDANSVEPMPESDTDTEWWSQRSVLAHIHEFARSRSVAPYAVLGCVLRRAIGCIDPHVKLPPIIGGAVSVNFYTVSTGRSGQGKDAADAAGFDAVLFPGTLGDYLDAVRPNLGTGEGLARLFKGSGKDQAPVTRAHLTVPEVATLAALAGRQGATLAGELLKGFMGQPLGFSNAQRETTTAIEAHSYRLCLGVGVQPENADFFLSREKDGFPQRFLWLPTIDPYAPEQRPDPIDPLVISLPDFGTDEYLVGVPESVRGEIIAHRHRVLIGADDVDPLDGHLMLTRLKVSFGLALLQGRKDVTEDDWKIGGDLLDVSVGVREQMRGAVESARRRQNTAKAYDQAERDDVVSDRKLSRCKQTVLRWLDKQRDREHISRRDLRQKLKADLRAYFDAAIAELTDEGKIEEITLDRGTGYTARTPVHRGTPQSTSDYDGVPNGVPSTPLAPMQHSEQGKRAEPASAPGDLTDRTPGYTDRVQQALANARTITAGCDR